MMRGALMEKAAVLLVLAGVANSGIVRYDQSQTGDYNVHLDLKNVDFLAFLDDSSSSFGEYDYDYGELTLKPPQASNNSTFTDGSSESPVLSSTEKIPDSNDGTTEAEGQGQGSPSPPMPTKPARRCGAGFYRDPAGRCRRQRRPVKISGLLNQAKNKIIG